MIFVAIACVLFFVLGCDKEPNGWYPVAGSYINLRYVKLISSNASVIIMSPNGNETVFSGPITSGGMKKIKKELSKKSSLDYSQLLMKAQIVIDDIKVILPTPKRISNIDEAEETLDNWFLAMKFLIETMNAASNGGTKVFYVPK